MTNDRLLEVQQLRPIDHLVMILYNIDTASRHQERAARENFEDFASMYPHQDVAAMLVQICADKSANYKFCPKVMKTLQEKHSALQ